MFQTGFQRTNYRKDHGIWQDIKGFFYKKTNTIEQEKIDSFMLKANYSVMQCI